MEYLLFRVMTSYWKTREGSQSWLNTALTELPMESPQLTFHHSPSKAEGGRRCRQHPSLSTPFQQSKKKRDVVLQQWRPQVSSHTEPHTQQSLRAESEFQAIGSGTSAASEYWFPLSPKARKHKKLLCVLVSKRGGIWVRRFRKWLWSQPSISQWESLNTLQLPAGSYTHQRASESWVPTPQNTGQNYWQTYPACVTSVPVTRMTFSAAGHIEKPGFLMPAWMRLHAADTYSFPAGGITQPSITHSLALRQPGWTECMNPHVNRCQCWGRQAGAAGVPSKFVPEENRNEVHVLVLL